jgi:virulence factor Mce-like protein
MNSPARGHVAIGLTLLLVIAGTVWGVLSAFTGHFSNEILVYADVPASGTGISPGSVVVFRDITVGTVGSLGRELPNGLLRAQLHITPGDLSSIPSDVKADVEIATVFGTQGINLVPPSTTLPGHLVAGATIDPVARSTTSSLQGDATDLDNLLKALHPAALDETLSAIATALKDQGPKLGTTIAGTSTYLHEMVPYLPAVVNDFDQLGPVSSALSQAAPSIIASVSNGSIVANTVNGQSTQLRQLLANGTPAADDLTGLLDSSQTAFENLVANAAPLLGDVAANPDFVAQTINGFNSWSKAFVSAESHGPFLSFSANIELSGAVQLVLGSIGVPGSSSLIEQGLGEQNFNPPTYTSADCPMYQGESGPNCPKVTAGSPTSSADSGHAASIIITPVQERAVAKITRGLNHGQDLPSLAVAALLLEPVLVHMTGAP